MTTKRLVTIKGVGPRIINLGEGVSLRPTCCDGTGWTGHPRVLCPDHYEPMGQEYFSLLHTE